MRAIFHQKDQELFISRVMNGMSEKSPLLLPHQPAPGPQVAGDFREQDKGSIQKHLGIGPEIETDKVQRGSQRNGQDHQRVEPGMLHGGKQLIAQGELRIEAFDCEAAGTPGEIAIPQQGCQGGAPVSVQDVDGRLIQRFIAMLPEAKTEINIFF
jgi:hypothetical protein